MSVRYIGSKARVARAILELAGHAPARFVDAFSGTGAVSAVAAGRGWPVVINDSLACAVSMSVGAVLGRGNVPFKEVGGYESAIAALNGLPGTAGFIHAEYSPASLAHANVERRYFTEANAARLDAMRRHIGLWVRDGAITAAEEHLLLADLIKAANKVANISGTYGCFLKEWTVTASKSVLLTPRELPNRTTEYTASVGNVFALSTTDQDVVYYDPPYTKRQYGAYYHILETIHAGDSPEVVGVTGLRPWRDLASDFCYKSKALDALTRLVMKTRAERILLSYSDEGHVPQASLVNALSEAGKVSVHEVQTIGRYRPNAKASANGDRVREYVVEIHPIRLAHTSAMVMREILV